MLYSALWRVLPGPAVVKILLLLVILAVFAWALFTFVFPWLSEYFTFFGTDVTVENTP